MTRVIHVQDVVGKLDTGTIRKYCGDLISHVPRWSTMEVYDISSPQTGESSMLIPLAPNDRLSLAPVVAFGFTLPLAGDQPLDIQRLKVAAQELLHLYPVLAGRLAVYRICGKHSSL